MLQKINRQEQFHKDRLARAAGVITRVCELETLEGQSLAPDIESAFLSLMDTLLDKLDEETQHRRERARETKQPAHWSDPLGEPSGA